MCGKVETVMQKAIQGLQNDQNKELKIIGIVDPPRYRLSTFKSLVNSNLFKELGYTNQ